MESAVLQLLEFYQKDLRESEEGQEALVTLGITSPSIVERFGLGYASGKAKALCSKEQRKILRKEGLIDRSELFRKRVVVPVLDANGGLQDIWGILLRSKAGRVRTISWRNPAQGFMGGKCLRIHTEILLCEAPLHALQLAQQGYPNVVAFADVRNLQARKGQFSEVERIYLYTKGLDDAVAKCLDGITIKRMKLARSSTTPVQGPTPQQESERSTEMPGTPCLQLTDRGRGTIGFEAGEVAYELDSQSHHINFRVQIKARRQGLLYLDRCDLGSAASRRTFARGCASRLQVASHEIEDHLHGMVQELERLDEASRAAEDQGPQKLSAEEQAEAMKILRHKGLLSRQAEALETCFGYVAEPENKRLALLVAASRLLEKPVSAIVRGPAASGKSALILAVSKLLSPWEVLYFSRMTAQSLYFLPREQLAHKLLVCDEYEGLEDSEYALRTMMSNQTLSLAITIREGGRVPVTRTVEIPATVAVLVSTTQQINVENLSRFVEMRLDTSGEQTRRVLASLARGSPTKNKAEVEALQRASGLLRPCHVEIPYAEKLIYQSSAVLARRQFAQVVGLISAHAALYQYQRDIWEDRGVRWVRAVKADYQAVHPLLSHVVDHVEEHLSPAAMEVLRALGKMKRAVITIHDVQSELGWSYSKTYRILRELEEVELLRADRHSAGMAKQYERAPYQATAQGIRQIADPNAVGPSQE